MIEADVHGSMHYTTCFRGRVYCSVSSTASFTLCQFPLVGSSHPECCVEKDSEAESGHKKKEYLD